MKRAPNLDHASDLNRFITVNTILIIWGHELRGSTEWSLASQLLQYM